jgi:lipopolysaccharide export system protein LptA
MNWQRRLRLGVGTVLLAFALVLYFAIGRRPPPPQTAVGRSDPAAVLETTPGTLTLANGETIAFERQLTYADGRSVLSVVRLETRDEQKREIVVTAREAMRQASPADPSRLGEVLMTGDVQVTTSDGLDLRTRQASYSDTTRMLRTADRVDFTRDRLTGSGTGATYDRTGDALWLLADARVHLSADAKGGGILRASAGSAGLERARHVLRLVGNAHIERPDRTIDAAEATLHLNDDDTRLTRAELRGGSRVTQPGATPGQLSAMHATTIDLDYAEDGAGLRRAQLEGDAAATGVDVAGEAGGAGRQIRAARLAVDLAPDGATITALEGREGVQLVWPAQGGRPAQSIRAAALSSQGTAIEGLRSARFTGGVEYREGVGGARAHAGSDRVARAAALDVVLKAQMGGIASARFQGAVTFSDGAWRGEAPEAFYDPEKGILRLTGPRIAAASLPRLADERVTVDAQAIELALDAQRLTADGRVQSVFRPGDGAAGAPAGDTRLPPMLDDRQPLYATAAKLVYDGGALLASYTGGSRLWQGDSLVRAEAITLDERLGNLTASGAVHSRLVVESAPTDGAGKGPAPTVGEAKELMYVDDTRTLGYAGDAHVVGGQGDIAADRVELILGRTGRGLVRAEAYDDVTARIEGEYTITGSRLTFLAEAQRYLAQGQPVRVLEQRADGCKETVGRLLTLEKSTDTITVVGTEGNRSKSLQVPCTERRR